MPERNPHVFPSRYAGDSLAPPHLSHGMTLRDWFAGQALAGMLAGGPVLLWSEVAADAYAQADAMLAERAKETPHA